MTARHLQAGVRDASSISSEPGTPTAANHICLRGHDACACAQNYGETAAREAHGGQKWISVREDWLERLVLRFFEQRIFGPMPLDKLAQQLRAHDREQRRNGKLAGTRIRQQIAELERNIKGQVQALERGSSRSWSRSGSASFARRGRHWRRRWPGSAPSASRQRRRSWPRSSPGCRISVRPCARPPPGSSDRYSSHFELRIAYDRSERRVELTATISEAVADAFENAKALLSEGSSVVVRDIAGPIRFSLPRTDHRASALASLIAGSSHPISSARAPPR